MPAPSTPKFYASGKGNGFPFCPLKVDVSGFGYWVTLSGFSKTSAGSPTEAEINASFINAWNFYWKLYAVRVTAEATQDFGTLYESSITNSDETILTPEPLGRPCEQGGLFLRNRSDPFATLCEIFASSGRIIRLYNGTTDNDSNFVGYGIDGQNVDLYANPGSSEYASEIKFYSYKDEFTGTDEELYDTDYFDVNGLHFVCRAKGFTTRSGADATATSIYPSQPPPGYNSSASIDSLEFYDTFT